MSNDTYSSLNNQEQNLNISNSNNSTLSNDSYGINIHNDIYLRHLCPDDIPELKKLCSEWFPVNYPDSWYQDIAANKRFFSIAATHEGRIIGMLVAEIKTKRNTDREDCLILSRKHSDDTQVTYILSLGVVKTFRRLGIASLLLDTLLNYLNKETDCKAIYLHVLCSNSTAIRFYQKRNFIQRIYLPNYYTINGELKDGYCYVYYMNNGEPPWTLAYPFLKIIKSYFCF